jgi:hypothetical protein
MNQQKLQSLKKRTKKTSKKSKTPLQQTDAKTSVPVKQPQVVTPVVSLVAPIKQPQVVVPVVPVKQSAPVAKPEVDQVVKEEIVPDQEDSALVDSELKPKTRHTPKSEIIGSFFEPSKITKRTRDNISKHLENHYLKLAQEVYPDVKSKNDEVEVELKVPSKKKVTKPPGALTKKSKKSNKVKQVQQEEKLTTRNGITYKVITAEKYMSTLHPKIKGDFSAAILGGRTKCIKDKSFVIIVYVSYFFK